jgi:putative SOS response-associated peptidase YedK
MCGRYTIAKPKRIVVEFEPDTTLFDIGRPRYNIAPMQPVPVVSVQEGKRVLAECEWGFVPHWAKDISDSSRRMINARSETAAAKPTFKRAFEQSRCLLPADGFYEWQKSGDAKHPIHLRLKDHSMFAFAGLRSRWDGGDEPLESCTILTVEANDFMKPIHHRMPVILPRGKWLQWLDPNVTDLKLLQEMMLPLGNDALEAVKVSRHVNSPANDDPRCIEPMA